MEKMAEWGTVIYKASAEGPGDDDSNLIKNGVVS